MPQAVPAKAGGACYLQYFGQVGTGPVPSARVGRLVPPTTTMNSRNSFMSFMGFLGKNVPKLRLGGYARFATICNILGRLEPALRLLQGGSGLYLLPLGRTAEKVLRASLAPPTTTI